jgi:hypothetical protein
MNHAQLVAEAAGYGVQGGSDLYKKNLAMMNDWDNDHLRDFITRHREHLSR